MGSSTVRIAHLLARAAVLPVAVAFHAAWLAQPLSPGVKTFHLLLLAVSIASPRAGLLASVALAPLTTSLSVALGSTYPGWTLLAAMLWSVASGVLIRGCQADAPMRFSSPALLLATTFVTSALVAIAGDPSYVTQFDGPLDAFRALFSGQLFQWIEPWIPLQHALLGSLALLLAVFAEATIRKDRETGIQLLRLLVIGHAAAAALSIAALVTAAAREDQFVPHLVRLFADVRFHSQYDVNAAGSSLVIACCAAIGLYRPARLPAITIVSFLLLIVGLWLTGSRAALAALAAAVVLKALLQTAVSTDRRTVATAGATITLVAVVAAGVYYFYPRERNVTTGVALQARTIMLKTAANAGLEHPVFGVGIGRLPARAAEFGSLEMKPLMGARGLRENAHNQYLQVFAELGAIGVLALLFAVLPVLGQGLRGGHSDPLRAWVGWGVVATMLTWMLGHPLLVPEAAFVFWISIGILAGLTPPADRWRVAHSLALALVGVLLVAGPLRVSAAGRSTYLEHEAVGLTQEWLIDHGHGIRYRSAATRFALYLPSGAAVVIPMRASMPSDEPLMVEISVAGRLIDRVPVSHVGWRQLTIRIPESSQLFDRVDFSVSGIGIESDGRGVLWIGKTVPVAASR